jgi:hypothetical protein
VSRTSAFLTAVGALSLFALGAPQANATLITPLVSEFAVLGQFSNNQTNFNNGTITGDVGIGSPRQFTASNASVVGSIRFSGAANVSGLGGPSPIPGPGPYTVSGGGTVSGGVFAFDAGVTNALNYTNDLSQALGGQAGTALTLNSSQTINASSGAVGSVASVDGNPLGSYSLFTTSSVSLSNATTLTINGSATDQVVIDVTDNNPAFNGMIVLIGGITSDDVLFNMFGGNYTTHTGGPTLTISTNGEITTGTFLDPNGGMQINHSVLDGRFFGGDVTNQQIVSGADINAPPKIVLLSVPEPGTIVLVLAGMLGMVGLRRFGQPVA